MTQKILEEVAEINGMTPEQIQNMSPAQLNQFEFQDEAGNVVTASHMIGFFQRSNTHKVNKDFKNGSRENYDTNYRNHVEHRRDREREDLIKKQMDFERNRIDKQQDPNAFTDKYFAFTKTTYGGVQKKKTDIVFVPPPSFPTEKKIKPDSVIESQDDVKKNIKQMQDEYFKAKKLKHEQESIKGALLSAILSSKNDLFSKNITEEEKNIDLNESGFEEYTSSRSKYNKGRK